PLKALAVRLYFSKVAIDVLKKLESDFILMTESISSYFISDINMPKIFITHNPPYGLLKSYMSFNYYVKLGLSLLEKLESHVFSNADYIIALNKTIMYYLYLKGFERIKVIPNGVEIYSDVKPYDGGYILYGGRLTPEKGVLYLLLAYKKLSEEEDIDQKLVIVGSGPQERLLKSYARSIKEKVIFIPFLPQHKFLKVLAGCSIFVLPSLYEASPVTILQAMSLGKPVIASNVPGPRDLIMHGITGFLFEPGDINALKEYLKLLIFDLNLRYKIGSKALEMVLKNYTFEKIADEYLKLFNELKYE
ncbi:MAG: glycosyltransferase family 4 protein, partial [Caldimicrobium sp.]|nr:glycosyltransferase family 4 protein [Caldimicrobium sp.]